MGSSLATFSASPLRTLWYIFSGPMDLWTFWFLRCSWAWSSPAEENSSFSQSLLFVCATQGVWLEHFLVKTEAKNSLSMSVFSMSCLTRSPKSLLKGATSYLVILLLLMYLRKLFLLPLMYQTRFTTAGALAFLTIFPAVGTISLFPSYLSLFPCSIKLPVCVLNLSSGSLFIHAGVLVFFPDFLFVGMQYVRMQYFFSYYHCLN